MLAYVEPKSKNTGACWRYIIQELIKNEPLRHGKFVMLQLARGRTPFPEITKIPMDSLEKNPLPPDIVDADIPVVSTNFDPKRTIQMQVRDELGWGVLAYIALSEYIQSKLSEMCEIRSVDVKKENPFDFVYSLTIINPQKIHQEAEKLGIKIISDENLAQKTITSSPQFLKERSKLIWGDKEIIIDRDSIEFDLCRYAFKQKPNEFILWSDVMEKIDWERTNDGKRGWRAIYDAVGRINKKTKLVVGKPLFKWGNKGFSRII